MTTEVPVAAGHRQPEMGEPTEPPSLQRYRAFPGLGAATLQSSCVRGCVATARKTWPGWWEMESFLPRSLDRSPTIKHFVSGGDQSGFSLSSMAEASFVDEAPQQMPINSVKEPVVPQRREETWAVPSQEKWS